MRVRVPARVKLNDELFADRHVDLVADRQLADGDLVAVVPHLQPGRGLAVQDVDVPLDDDHLACLGAQGDDVALLAAVAGDVHPATVHVDVAVVDELACLGPGGGHAGPVDHVVQAQLQEPEHVLAGHALTAAGLLVDPAELLLGEAIGKACLLLLLEL